MSGWRDDYHREQDHEVEQTFDELTRRPAAPDMTRSIMGRLGYMQVAPAVSRRRTRRVWSLRLVSTVGGVLILAAGAAVYQMGPWARRPAGPTVPAAIGREVDLHQRRFNQTLESFWKLAPRVTPVESPAGATPAETDLDRAILGPIC